MNETDKLYLNTHVFPFIPTDDNETPPLALLSTDTGQSSSLSSCSLSDTPDVMNSEKKDKWACLLRGWLARNKKEMEIQLVQTHKKFIVAVVSILYEENEQHVDMIQSLCLMANAQGFEACFRDLYLNTNICGRAQENTNGSAYTLSVNISDINDRYLLCTGHFPPKETEWSQFAGTVAKFRALFEVADYVNKLERDSKNKNFIISKRLDNGEPGECCSLLQVYDLQTLKLHTTVFPQNVYRVAQTKLDSNVK